MVNISDVARHAGVSRSTVSYVLSGKRQISASTRDTVRRSIEELGFRPDPAALALTTRRTHTVALAATLTLTASPVDVAALDDFIMSTAFALRSHGYDMLLLAQQSEEQIQRLQRGVLTDALIVMDVLWRDARLPLLAESRYPVVLMGAPEDDHGLSVVDLDYTSAGRLAVDHLRALGHRDIVLVSGPTGLNSVTRVERGALQSSGVNLTVIRSTADDPTFVRDNLATILDATAIVLHDQTQMPHVLQALRDRRVAIPHDTSVVAIATESAMRSDPAITLVPVPVGRIVALAADIAIEAIEQTTPRHVLLPPELIDRRSTAAPRARR